MKIYTIVVGDFQENCYVVQTEDNCTDVLVVDPGDGAKQISGFVKERGLNVTAIILTHGHLDHVKGCGPLAEEWDVKVYAHKKEFVVYQSDANEFPPYLMRDCELPTPTDLKDFPSGAPFKVLETPGHTPGGVCFYFPKDKVIFVGDSLFHRSIGRTDLPGGDMGTLLHSIRTQILTLPGNTVVYSGHGPTTTVAGEKSKNPYVNHSASR